MPPEDALAVLIHRSADGDPDALSELRGELPHLLRWGELEVLAGQAREAWADVASDGDPAARAAVLTALDQAAAELSRPNAGPLERLLARWAALAGARLAHLRQLAATPGQPAPPAVVLDLARRVGRAERDAARADRALREVQLRLARVGRRVSGAEQAGRSGVPKGR